MASSSVVTVIGARPQFVKAAVVSRALRAAGMSECVIHTGQHYDPRMSDLFFQELGMPQPAVNLGLGGGSHGEQTGAMLAGIERVLRSGDSKPSWVLVYGDTNSTLAGALAAAKLGVPVAHVEAGLRSWNRTMPEEINRVAVDHMASLLLCPTEDAVANLRREGMGGPGDPLGREVHQVGDVMLDATLEFGGVAEARSTALHDHGLRPGGFVLATVHRAENTDDPSRLGVIVDALEGVAATMPVIWPVHPRTRRVLDQASGAFRRVRLCDPMGYLDMLALERAARCIVTDSGGVQKEAFFAGVPCVTVRKETEWLELVRCGWNTVVPPLDPSAIVDAVIRARPGVIGSKPFGDGTASVRIASLLRRT